MTREEALQYLYDFRDNVSWDGMPEEALDMAIKALEQEPTTKNNIPHCQCTDEEIAKSFIEDVEAVKELLPTTKNNLGVDCISRAEMLKYQEYLHGKMSNEENHKLWEFIKELPSVTPQEPKIFPIAEIKYDKDKLKELVNNAVLTVTPQEPNIKVLEQEPILDKIYADIQRLRGCSCSCSDGIIDDIEDIIDKYKAESEDKE